MRMWLRLFGLTMIIALLVAASLPFIQADLTQPDTTPERHRIASFSPLPPIDVAASRSITEKSPFVRGRAAFDRETASTPPRPPVDVRLTGVSRLGKELRASLRIDGQMFTVRKGDQTPIGVVASIEESAVVIDGATSQRFEMFKQ